MTMTINMHDRKRIISTYRGSDWNFVSLTIREDEDRNEVTLFFNDEDDLLKFAERVTEAAKWLARDPERIKKDEARDKKERSEMAARLMMKKVRRFAKSVGLIPGEILSDDPFYQAPAGYVLFSLDNPHVPVASGSDFNTLRSDYFKKVKGKDVR